MKQINKLVLTGLHKSGKSTFINKLTSSQIHRNLSTIRLNVNDVISNLDKFSFDTYFNLFNLYDRLLPIEFFVYYAYPNDELVKQTLLKIKPYFENSLICMLNFEFAKDTNNTIPVRESYKKLYEVLQELRFPIKVINSKEEYFEFTESFNLNYEIKSDNHWIRFNDYIDSYSMLNTYECLDYSVMYQKQSFNFELKNLGNDLITSCGRRLLDENHWTYCAIILDYTNENHKNLVKKFSNRISNIILCYKNIPKELEYEYIENKDYNNIIEYYSDEDDFSDFKTYFLCDLLKETTIDIKELELLICKAMFINNYLDTKKYHLKQYSKGVPYAIH